ncbi:MAG: hypothetical protein CHACPFDD_01092 [Phycisphaerae bacterium]|nr:hypothetical protein [Phycisphaerae bacterium]
MWDNVEPVRYRPTPDEILAIIREWHRLELSVDHGVKDAQSDLRLTTTVFAWRLECDLLGWKRVARWLNSEFEICAPLSEWRRVLTPSWRRTLGDVCTFLAARVELQRLVPATILGRSCLEAGAFLSLRNALKRAGNDTSELAPSTLLDACTDQEIAVIAQSALRWAPGALQFTRCEDSRGMIAPTLFLAMMSLATLGVWLQNVGVDAGAFLSLGAILIGGPATLLALCIIGRLKAPRLRFVSDVTFRDLCRRITEKTRSAGPSSAAIGSTPTTHTLKSATIDDSCRRD